MHDPAHAVAPRRFEHIERADQVDLRYAPRVARVALHIGSDSRHVDYGVWPVLRQQPLDGVGVGDIAELVRHVEARRCDIENHHALTARDELLDHVQADEAGAAGDDDHFRMPPDKERGSRRAARPSSTRMKKSSSARLNASGSSMLIVWPDHGTTSSPAVAMCRFMSNPGSRHGSSSSPVMMSVGTLIFFIASVSS